jgi:protein TonB
MRVLIVSVMLAGVAASAGAALAQESTNFDRRPTAQDFAQYYPARAMDLGKEGRAILNCVVQADGLVAGCRIASETPDGLGFGAAAMRLSRLFRVREDSRVAGSHIVIPINFRLAPVKSRDLD